jgi:hypothetical protein
MLVTDEDMHNGCGGAGGVVAVHLTPDLRGASDMSRGLDVLQPTR